MKHTHHFLFCHLRVAQTTKKTNKQTKKREQRIPQCPFCKANDAKIDVGIDQWAIESVLNEKEMRLYETICRRVGLHGLHTFECIATPNCTGNCLSRNLCLKQIKGVEQIQTQHTTHTHTHTHTNIGIVECDERITRFDCPVCYKTCCMTCKVCPYHIGMNCQKFRERHRLFVAYNERNDAILASNLIDEGAVSCPRCHEIIIKIGGC